MATVRKRNEKYVVIYDYMGNTGKRKQRWETFNTKTEANKCFCQNRSAANGSQKCST